MGLWKSIKKVAGKAFGFLSNNNASVANVATTAAGIASDVYGQRSANRANSALATDQMAFQERMSGSAHARNVKDLRNAGLNPLLSAQYGGSSTPTGSTAHHESITRGVGERMSGTARHLSKLTPELALLRSQKSLVDLQSEKIGAEASSARSNATIDAIDADIASTWYGKLAKKASAILRPIGQATGAAGSVAIPFMAGKALKSSHFKNLLNKKHKLKPKGKVE